MRTPTVTPVLRPVYPGTDKHPIYLQITFKGKRAWLSVNEAIPRNWWDEEARRCYTPLTPGGRPNATAKRINGLLDTLIGSAESHINMAAERAKLERSADLKLSVDDLKAKLLPILKPEVTVKPKKKGHFLVEAIFRNVESLRSAEQFGTANSYASTGRVFQEFLKHEGIGQNGDIAVEDLTKDILKRFKEDYLTVAMECRPTSIRQYFTVLGTHYGELLADKNINIPNVFTLMKTKRRKGSGRVKVKKKHKLTLDQLAQIRELKLSGLKEKVRDIFLFCVFNNGTRIGDAVSLKSTDTVIKEMKTGKYKAIEKNALVQEILNKYKGGKYVFGLIDENISDPETLYRKKRVAVATVNTYLREHIAPMCGFDFPLSSHVARHTFADIAADTVTSLRALQAMLGHSSEEMTRNYINEIAPGKFDAESAKVAERFMMNR